MRGACRARVEAGARTRVGVGGLWLVLIPLLVHAACATGAIEELTPAPLLFGPDASAALRLACVDTECPAPFLTCPDEKGGPCSTDPRSDIDHCGACDTPCPTPTAATHGSFLCSEGKCRLACDPLFADCNGLVEDGCEVATAKDPSNCGACGNSCDGGLCWRGACGCPNGLAECDGACVNLSSDRLNCSACGVICKEPDSDTDPRWICGPKITPKDTVWQCSGAECKLDCKPRKADCNTNFCGDGCETDIYSDRNNCGKCGNVCSDGQACVAGTCLCPNDGTTLCWGECVNLTNDPNNCGACGDTCPSPNPEHGGAACIDGKCVDECYPGFADCDKRDINGCEVDLNKDQLNCGSCGTQCDIAAGQPCVNGVCLTKPCVEGPLH